MKTHRNVVVPLPLSVSPVVRQAIFFLTVGLGMAVMPTAAHAYLGQGVLEFASSWIIGPLALIMIVVAAVSAFVKPEAVKTAGYIAVSASVVYLIIANAGTLLQAFQKN